MTIRTTGDDEVMTHEGELLEAYRRLEVQGSRLVHLARDEDWQALLGEQENYTRTVEGIADLEQAGDLDEPRRQAKHDLLERILQHDLEVRSRLLARREELTRLIAVSRREGVLNRSYGKTRAVAAGLPVDHRE